MKVIIFEDLNGNTTISQKSTNAQNPDDSPMTLEQFALKVVPDGQPYWFVEEDDLPLTHRSTWKLTVSDLGSSGGYPIGVVGKIKQDKDKKDKRSKKEVKFWSRKYMDDVAIEQEYEGILDLCSFINSADQEIIAEAQAGITFRDEVKAYYKQVNKDVKDGLRAPPTQEELIAELPEIIWV